jgi:hypothetical protein
MTLDHEPAAIPRPQLNRTLQSFSLPQCYIDFRFCRPELEELIPLLKFPRVCVLRNRKSMGAEEVILRGLYELCNGHNQEHIAEVFGGEQPLQSLVFSYFIEHMYSRFAVLVHDNLDWWHRNGFFTTSAAAIGSKMGVGNNLVALFIDCNCLPTCVVGGGPTDAGANSARWSDVIQRSFYNGWKSVHGLKHQTVNNAFGFTVDMTGPESLRRNDLFLLRKSRIVERLKNIQVGDLMQYIIFGDSAYRKSSHLTSYHKAVEGIDGFKEWNRKMKSVRISIEWDYGYTATLFKYITNQEKLKVLGSRTVARIYTVCTILRNIRIGYYGCQTSNYFDLEVPGDFVKHYLSRTDFVE